MYTISEFIFFEGSCLISDFIIGNIGLLIFSYFILHISFHIHFVEKMWKHKI